MQREKTSNAAAATAVAEKPDREAAIMSKYYDGVEFPFCDEFSKYEKMAKIGQGTFGEVFKAKHRQTGKKVALKKVLMENEKEGFPITALREIKILQLLKHENVVNLIEICRTKDTKAASTWCLTSVRRLAGLLSNANVKFTLAEIKKVMQMLLNGLYYIHRNKKYELYQKMELPKGQKRKVKDRLKAYVKDPYALDLIDKLLVLDPAQRIDSDDALNHDFFWSDPMPSDLKNMLSTHNTSMFEYLAPPRRRGHMPQQQPNQNRNPATTSQTEFDRFRTNSLILKAPHSFVGVGLAAVTWRSVQLSYDLICGVEQFASPVIMFLLIAFSGLNSVGSVALI
ncbi:hypothetical protein F7725_015193 [Dissostichus mawsoni]|uniref:Protein kinase domain-containing protein n=1 Tax=Dissostichus mawsoni TaxID=36200 RepID=A0A7J5YGS0_DISMA|nr:hypothetical protein F7725_015193 [Dissostichus mawsoni]